MGISSLSFSNTGNGIYLSSSSELQQISLSARNTVAAGGGRVVVERAGEGEGDTDSQADRQNRQNEREAGRGGGKSPRELGDSDPNNDTVMSEVGRQVDGYDWMLWSSFCKTLVVSQLVLPWSI